MPQISRPGGRLYRFSHFEYIFHWLLYAMCWQWSTSSSAPSIVCGIASLLCSQLSSKRVPFAKKHGNSVVDTLAAKNGTSQAEFEWFIIQFNWVMRADWLRRWMFQTNTLTLLPKLQHPTRQHNSHPTRSFQFKVQKAFRNRSRFSPALVGISLDCSICQRIRISVLKTAVLLSSKTTLKPLNFKVFLNTLLPAGLLACQEFSTRKSCYATFNLSISAYWSYCLRSSPGA